MNPTYNIIKHISDCKTYGLYIHVPFCHGRCAYCDFYSQTACDSATQNAFIDALRSSILSLSKTDVPLSTVYFGGGTPSVLGQQLAELVAFIKQNLPVLDDAEVTVEVNPESLDGYLLESLQASGVNRISMGVQALDDRVLSLLARLHTKKEALAALALLKESGISYSADFIAAIPSTTPVDMKSWIDEVMEYRPHHLSIYPLSVEPRSPLAALPLFQKIDEDFAADCLEQAWDEVNSRGFRHYEISNFAREGKESRHNSSYWLGASYIGIGPSASSALNHKDGSRARFMLRESLRDFCAQPLREVSNMNENFEILSAAEALREDVMLAMRLSSGVQADKVKEADLTAVFSSLEQDGFVRFDHGANHFVPTRRGWMLGNEMFGAIWCAEN